LDHLWRASFHYSYPRRGRKISVLFSEIALTFNLQARSEEAIKRKILEKVATFSTSEELIEEDDGDEADASAADSVDPDIVLTTGSDADSSGGSKVVATSIDGEDELVDVTMKDSNSALDSSESNTDAPKSSEPVKST